MNKIIQGDCVAVLKTLDSESVDCCITSPPYYGLRDYGNDGQVGLEKTPDEYIAKLVAVFSEVKRVLKPAGNLWLNLGDCYSGSGGPGSWVDNKQTEALKGGNPNRKVAGLKPKDLIGIPWMAAFALRQDGWYLRQDIIWEKPNPMPESVKDRCTKSHEYVFLLSKNQKYYFNTIYEKATGYDGRKDTHFKGSKKYKDSGHTMAERGHERWQYKNLQDKGQATHTLHENRTEGVEYLSPVRNKRSVWSVSTKPFSGTKIMTDYVTANGTAYTASQDCPIHGHFVRSRKSYTPGYGEQPTETSHDISDTDNRHASKPACESKPKTFRSHSEGVSSNSFLQKTGNMCGNKTLIRQSEHTLPLQNLAHSSCSLESREPLDCKKDLPVRACSETATFRNNRSSKIDPAHQTLEHDTASAQKPFGIQSISQSGQPSDLAVHKHENKNGTGDSSVRPLVDTIVHNVDRFSYNKLYCTCTKVSIDHFATFPEKLIEPMILAGCPAGGTVLDPFSGAGTTGVVAKKLHRKYIGIELNPDYIALAEKRIAGTQRRLFLA